MLISMFGVIWICRRRWIDRVVISCWSANILLSLSLSVRIILWPLVLHAHSIYPYLAPWRLIIFRCASFERTNARLNFHVVSIQGNTENWAKCSLVYNEAPEKNLKSCWHRPHIRKRNKRRGAVVTSSPWTSLNNKSQTTANQHSRVMYKNITS